MNEPANLNLTLREMVTMQPAIQSFTDITGININIAFRLARTLLSIAKELDTFNNVRVSLIQKYGKLNPEDPNTVPRDSMHEFQTEMASLLDEVIPIATNWTSLDWSAFSQCKIPPMTFCRVIPLFHRYMYKADRNIEITLKTLLDADEQLQQLGAITELPAVTSFRIAQFISDVQPYFVEYQEKRQAALIKFGHQKDDETFEIPDTNVPAFRTEMEVMFGKSIKLQWNLLSYAELDKANIPIKTLMALNFLFDLESVHEGEFEGEM